jgi:hypothetical protein
MSNNQSRLKQLAVGMWVSLALSMVLYLAQTSSTHYRAGTTDQSKRENSTEALKSQPAGPSTEAQFNPRSIDPVLLAASGLTGPYFDRFGLRYYREAYPETTCSTIDWSDGSLGALCIVGGDYHADDVYFPDPNMRWI